MSVDALLKTHNSHLVKYSEKRINDLVIIYGKTSLF
jgi:hypothetical protein